MGFENARRCAGQLLGSQSFDLMVSTGFTCALVEADIGALLAGLEVVQRTEQRVQSSPAMAVTGGERDLALAFVETIVPPQLIGRFVSTDRVVGIARDKREFAESTNAIGLDMESAALAAAAQRAQVPFLIIRSVSDLLDEDLPLDFNLFLRPTGWMKGIRTVLAAPSCLWGLGRLRRQSAAAGQALTEFFRRYTAAMATNPQQRELSPISQ
jgi:adenosylhomocysteine nucleosidase